MANEATSEVEPNASLIELRDEHPFKVETIQEEATYINAETLKDDKPASSTSDSKNEDRKKQLAQGQPCATAGPISKAS